MAGHSNSLFGDFLDDYSSAGVLDGTRNAVELGMISISILGDALGVLVAMLVVMLV